MSSTFQSYTRSRKGNFTKESHDRTDATQSGSACHYDRSMLNINPSGHKTLPKESNTQPSRKTSSKMNLIKAKLDKYLPNALSNSLTQKTTSSISKCGNCESENSTKWHSKLDGKLLCNTCHLCEQIYKKKTLLAATQEAKASLPSTLTRKKTFNQPETESETNTLDDLQSQSANETDNNVQFICDYCGTNETIRWWKCEDRRYCNACQRKVVKEQWINSTLNEKSCIMHCRFCPAVYLNQKDLERHERHHLKPYDNEKFRCKHCTFHHYHMRLHNHVAVHSKHYFENWKRKYLLRIYGGSKPSQQVKESHNTNEQNCGEKKIIKLDTDSDTDSETQKNTTITSDSDNEVENTTIHSDNSSDAEKINKLKNADNISDAKNMGLDTTNSIKYEQLTTSDSNSTDNKNMEMIIADSDRHVTKNNMFSSDDKSIRMIVPDENSDRHVKKNRSKGLPYDRKERICSNKNCRLTHSVVWRRDEDGNVLCNACHLYLGRRQMPRPPELVTNITMSKRRKKGSLSHLTKVSLPFLSENELAAISAYDQNSTQQNNVTVIQPIEVDSGIIGDSLQQLTTDSVAASASNVQHMPNSHSIGCQNSSVSSEQQSSQNTECPINNLEQVQNICNNVYNSNSGNDTTGSNMGINTLNEITDINTIYNINDDINDKSTVQNEEVCKLNEITDIQTVYNSNTVADDVTTGPNLGVTLFNNVPVIHIVPEDTSDDNGK